MHDGDKEKERMRGNKVCKGNQSLFRKYHGMMDATYAVHVPSRKRAEVEDRNSSEHHVHSRGELL